MPLRRATPCATQVSKNNAVSTEVVPVPSIPRYVAPWADSEICLRELHWGVAMTDSSLFPVGSSHELGSGPLLSAIPRAASRAAWLSANRSATPEYLGG